MLILANNGMAEGSRKVLNKTKNSRSWERSRVTESLGRNTKSYALGTNLDVTTTRGAHASTSRCHCGPGKAGQSQVLIVMLIGSETPFQAMYTDSLVANTVPWGNGADSEPNKHSCLRRPRVKQRSSARTPILSSSARFSAARAYHNSPSASLARTILPNTYQNSYLPTMDVYLSHSNTAKHSVRQRQSGRAARGSGKYRNRFWLKLLYAIYRAEHPHLKK